MGPRAVGKARRAPHLVPSAGKSDFHPRFAPSPGHWGHGATSSTGEICSPALIAAQPERDWILSRILWLSGCEPGRNRFGLVDTMRRYIYIHGTPDCEVMGVPFSHGCIRMRNADVMELFFAVRAGTPVEIIP